jgi:tetratricopeptide (TPR) repeat protein
MPEKPMSQIPFALRELYDKGIAAMQKKNFDYAITLFMQALRQEPGFYEAREALRATQHQRITGKTSFFRKFVGSASTLTRGQVALRTNPLDAIVLAEETLNEDPVNVSAHELLADAAMAAGLPKTAILSLEVAFKNKPTDRKLALELADAAGQLGQRARAERIFRDLLRKDPGDIEVNERMKNMLASRTMHEGGYAKLEGGEGSYRDVLKDKAEAVSLEQQNRSVKDVDVVANLITQNEAKLAKEPDNLKLIRDLADLYLKKSDFDRAIDYLNRYLKQTGVNDPSVLEALRDANLARFEHRERSLDATAPDHAEKLAELRAARQNWRFEDVKRRADLNPTDLHIRYELGELYLQAGKVGEAIAELQKAQNNPNRRIPAMNLLAQAFAKRGMNDLAARKLQEALKEKLIFDEETKDLHYQLGCVFDKMGKKEEAMEHFKTIYEQDVSYRDVMARVDAYYATQG